ncbi:unnamed protein product [Soboliphyme baturini]|uniref:SH3 domain-containing protein n=1 Tax=Soboliphyme baturini TaxID=241478 RepID=A0A183ILW6_9BILA|nr:unnamed protein product [Soboliphyme baturini]
MEETLACCSTGSAVADSAIIPSCFQSNALQVDSIKECGSIGGHGTSVVVVNGAEQSASQDLVERRTGLFVKSEDGGGCQSESGKDPANVSMANMKTQPSVLAVDQATESPPPDLIPASDKSKFQFQQGKPGADMAKATRALVKDFNRIESDKINVRGDTLRATKRRSWADHRCAMTDSETEHIQMLLCREQRKGKSSVNFSWILGQLIKSPPKSETPTVETALVEKKTLPVVLEAHGISDDSSSTPDTSDLPESYLEDDRLADKIGVAYDQCQLKPILKTQKATEKKTVRFDPLALLLDAALEGELELVKRCAAEVESVSCCNDEGITALHNAICAGHYDILRFLVEAGANVNAQDSDGWTPLHCAASCNNLPMVKFLIERGACVFASTISDDETPTDKCEEDEEGFVGCSQFLISIQEKMGSLNSGLVYAAFDFDASMDDELSLTAGEELQVIRRDESQDKGWWFARSVVSGKEGYVPRNYLSVSLICRFWSPESKCNINQEAA